MAKVVELKCVAEKKQFVDEKTGSVVEYITVGVILNEQFVKLTVPKESKQLFNYLIKDIIK